MRWTEPSLVRRVGGLGAATAIAATLVTLLVALSVIDSRVMNRAEQEALSRSQGLARELDAEIGDDKPFGRSHLQQEVAEFSYGGMTIAIFDPGGRRLAGADVIPWVPTAGCTSGLARNEKWMVCRSSTESASFVVLVGIPQSQLLDHRQALWFGGLAALLVVGLAAVGSGLWLGSWSLRPLLLLQASLAKVDVSRPLHAKPLPQSGLVELDAVTLTMSNLLARLDAELQRSRRFSSSAAHELRTPLAKLRTELELIGEDSPEGLAYMPGIRRCIARTQELSTLVDSLLLLASPGVSLRGNATVSLASVVESVLEEFGNVGERVHCLLHSPALVRGEASVLSILASNAIGNALKYSKGPVHVSVTESVQEAVLQVKDEGVGLSDTNRMRVFEEFFRAPEHRAMAGSGIGLTLVAHIAMAHGGSAEFIPTERGACLVVRFQAALQGTAVPTGAC